MISHETTVLRTIALTFFIGLVSAASMQRRILREVSAETQPSPAQEQNNIGTQLPKTDQEAMTNPSTIETTTLKPRCTGNEPCGWAVYEKFSRIFQYYIDNVCRCPSHKHCHRTGDDLINSAYIYTCIEHETNETFAMVHPPSIKTTTPQ